MHQLDNPARWVASGAALLVMFAACASPNVWFTRTDETYQPVARPPDARVVFQTGRIERPHRVIGVLTAELGREAERPQLDALLLGKAREVGADGVMLVEYDVDREVYLESHHAVVGRGPWRRHVVGRHRRVDVTKTATGIAVRFE